MIMPNFTYNDELYHYGVKGMRWRNRKKKNYPSDQYPEYKGPGVASNDYRYGYLNNRYRKSYEKHMSSWTSRDNEHHNYVKEKAERRRKAKAEHDAHMDDRDREHAEVMEEAKRRRKAKAEHDAHMDDRDREHAKAVEEARRRRAGFTGTTASPTRSPGGTGSRRVSVRIRGRKKLGRPVLLRR